MPPDTGRSDEHVCSDSSPGAVRVVRDAALAAVPGLAHAFAERTGGVSTGRYTSLNLGPRSGDDPEAVRENRRRLLATVGLADLPVLAPRQVHSAEVAVLRGGDPLPSPGVCEGDALVTDRRGLVLMVLAADCVPVLLFDATRAVIAAVHAGWRGTAGGIVAHTVAAMRDGFGCDPAHVRAAIGPAIGRCCYEVGGEVIEAVAGATPLSLDALRDPLPAGKGRLDLIAANTAQLIAAGLVPAHIGAAGLCTACHVDRFFSHRREGEPTGRGGAVLALV